MAYAKKLASPKWQQRRLEIMNRDNWTCRHCGDTTTQLEVHHIDYWENKQPWDYHENMLITVCRKCHSGENRREKYEQNLLTSMKANGFIALDVDALASMLYTHNEFKNLLLRKIREFIRS